MTIYVTYVTIYQGNKLPPFYIGYTSKENISKGYKGSVSSKQYKDVWYSEIRNNPHLFKTKIIKEFDSKQEAILHEEKLHVQFNVDENPLYTNKIKSRHYWTNKGGYKISDEKRKNMKWGDDRERVKKQSILSTKRNKEIWASYTEEQRAARSKKISESRKGQPAHNKNVPRSLNEKKAISDGTKKAMDNEKLRKHLSEKAKKRGTIKICCLECKRVITAPNFPAHVEKHDGIEHIYVHNGNKQLKIRKGIDEIPEGFVRGRLSKRNK